MPLSTISSSIELRIAQTPQEKTLAYNLRYNVFTLEKNDTRYANHELQIYKDHWDQNLTSLLLIAHANDRELIGTLRVVFRREGPYLGEEAYHYEILAQIIQKPVNDLWQKTAILTRGAVAQEYRQKGVFRHLLKYAEAACKDEYMDIMIAVTDHNNKEASSFFHKHHYQLYGTFTNNIGWTGNYFYKTIDALSKSTLLNSNLKHA